MENIFFASFASALVTFVSLMYIYASRIDAEIERAMIADYDERFQYWLEDCQSQPWKHEPPIRPTCEEMTRLLMDKINAAPAP